jgi:hypothetical protein
MTETIALAVNRVLVENGHLQDAIHLQRVELMARERRIAELERCLNSHAGPSASSADIDVIGSDRDFD